jgi:drug/metabolite transporter (DMT)-like permease
VAVVLALACALVWGAADFCGGLASRRAAALAVVALSHVSGLALLVLLLPWLGGNPRPGDLAWGAAAGIAGGAGLALFYRALARGVMSVVAPVTAVTAAAVPVVAGVLDGERVGTGTAAGVALALAAVVLVSAQHGLSSLRSARVSDVGPALLAGGVFGLFFVLLDRTGDDAALSPLVASRIVSVALVVGLSLIRRRSLAVPRPALAWVLLAGIGDVSAGALFLIATQVGGQLAVVGVLASLYPVSTVVLAQVVLHERLVAAQVCGLLLASGAVVLITVGS